MLTGLKYKFEVVILKPIKILVTGASGFLGRTIVSLLHKKKVDVIPVSRRKSKCNRNNHWVDDYNKTPSGDVLIHLAESADVFQANEKKEAYIDENKKRLESILSNQNKKIIYISSAVVYGDASDSEHYPEENTNPDSWYGKAKIVCEKIVLNNSPKNIIVRLSNVYGPFMSSRNVISDILRQNDESSALYIKNDKPIRDFIWSDDVAECLYKMALSEFGGIYNLGSGCPISIRKLAEIVLKLRDMQDREIVSKITESRDSILCLNIEKTIDTFDWVPEIPLKEGLSKLLKNQ